MIEKLTFGLFTKQDSQSFMRLLAYIKPYKVRLFWAILAIVGVAFTESYLAAFIAPLVNQGFAAPSEPPQIIAGTDFLTTLQNLKNEFNYLIWGTKDKV